MRAIIESRRQTSVLYPFGEGPARDTTIRTWARLSLVLSSSVSTAGPNRETIMKQVLDNINGYMIESMQQAGACTERGPDENGQGSPGPQGRGRP
jgi:hypothetical protein